MDINSICLNCFGYRGGYEVCPHCGYVAGTLAAEAWALPPSTVLGGRYLVGTPLGSGGFGITYRAWDASLDIPVAVKEFYPQNLVTRIPGETEVRLFSGEKQQSFATQLARFMDEARGLAQFTGEAHIVNVFDFFEANGTAYIIMEYLDGMTLKQYMAERGGVLPEAEAIAIAEGVLNGLARIHQRHIIHRDISPDNLFMLQDGSVKILDFGAARFGDDDNADLGQGIVIKMGYAPPEQYRANMPQGVWTDIYAAGATLYKMLTGQTPEESIDRMEKDILRRPSQMGAPVSAGVDKAVMKAMALKPELRFTGAEAMLNALQSKTQVDFPEEELKKRKRLRLVLVSLAVVLVAGIGALVAWQVNRPTVETLADLTLEPDSITLCLPVWEDSEAEVYREIAEAFTRQYPEHTVNVTTSTHADFSSTVFATLGTPEGPTLLQSSRTNPTVGTQVADLGLLYNSLDKQSLWYLSDWESLYPGRGKMPTAMNLMVAYTDEVALAAAGQETPNAFTGFSQLATLAESGSTVVLSGGDAAAFIGCWNPGMLRNGRFVYSGALGTNIADLAALYANSGFVAGSSASAPVHIGWASQLRSVQQMWPGYYGVAPLRGQNGLVGTLAGEWSVNAAATDNQQKVAMLFIHFLLGEYAQNMLYIQQDVYVPLNRAALEPFTATNTEFAFLTASEMNRIAPYGQNGFDISLFSNALYSEVLAPEGTGQSAKSFIDGY